MDQTVKDILLHELHEYSRDPINGRSYLTLSPNGTMYAIIGIAKFQNKHLADADLIVECLDEWIVIHYDGHSIPLYESLVDAGIPRERIILAYAGETIPESKPTGE